MWLDCHGRLWACNLQSLKFCRGSNHNRPSQPQFLHCSIFRVQPPLQLDEGFCYIYIGLLLSALGENEGPAMGCRGPYIYGQGMLVYLNNEPDRWLLFFYRLKHVQGQDLLKIDAVTLRVRYRQSAFAQLPEK